MNSICETTYFWEMIAILGKGFISSLIQGSYGSWKTWKVLEFYSGIFQDWKVLEKTTGLGNFWKSVKLN